MAKLPRIIEERIERRERRGRIIKTGEAQPISYPSAGIVPEARRVGALVWNLRYMIGQKTSLSKSSAFDEITITVIHNKLTISLTEDAGNGVFDAANSTYTDAGETWTVNVWANYYLKVDSAYYKILSNTADVLTLDIDKGVWIDDAAYAIVPFIPGMLIGGKLNPDTSQTMTFTIWKNTETEIYVRTRYITAGVVTTGDAGVPYDTFRYAITKYEDDKWDNYSIHWGSGDNKGEIDYVSAFTGATGEFVVSTGFTNTIDVDDVFIIARDMFYASASTEYRLEVYYPISKIDFEDADPEDIEVTSTISQTGAIIDFNRQQYYSAMYSAEVMSNTQRTITLPVGIRESLRIDLTDLAKAETLTLLDSGYGPNATEQISFMLRAGIWYRMDIFIYHEGIPESDYSFKTKTKPFYFDPLAPYIHSWRDVTPEAPVWISVTGADSNNDPDYNTMLMDSIKLLWNNSIFIGQGGFTEIWICATESGTYTLDGKIEAQTRVWNVPQDPGTTKWFKIRHVSAAGIVGPYSSAHKGMSISYPGSMEITGIFEFSDLVEFPREV